MKKKVWCFYLLLLSLIILVSIKCMGRYRPSIEVEKSEEDIHCAKLSFEDSLGNLVTVKKLERVGVCTGSLAHLWQLAGGNITATTNDTFDYEPVDLEEGTIDLGDLKRVNVEQILEAKLDLLILSTTIQGHLKLQDTLTKAGIATAYFSVECFEEYLEVLHSMTLLTGREDLYQENGLDVLEEVKEQQERKKEAHPRILLLRALTTEIKVQDSDTMVGVMLKDLGCVNLADRETKLLEGLSLEVILKENPEIIFITLMGDEQQARALIQKSIYDDIAWSQLQAVNEGRSYILPKELFHNKPNQRWGESYRMLANILYEE